MRLLTILVATALVAGCTTTGSGSGGPLGSPSDPAASRPPPPPPAPNASATPETGAITGIVADDEQRPVERVKVVLVQSLLETLTDAEGRFTFNDLQPGDHAISFQRVGYEETARKVTVVAGEVAEVKVTMTMIALPEGPYHLSIPKRAYIKASWVFVTSAGGAANDTGIISTFCDPCIFHLHYPGGEALKEIKPEAVWAAFPLQPAVNEDIWLQYYVQYTADADGTATQTGYVKNRKALVFTPANTNTMSKYNTTRLKVHGALLGLNVEHKPEVWTTFAYGEKLPGDFTALPPP